VRRTCECGESGGAEGQEEGEIVHEEEKAV